MYSLDSRGLVGFLMGIVPGTGYTSATDMVAQGRALTESPACEPKYVGQIAAHLVAATNPL